MLARDIVSTIDVPAHDNSAMDGYALRGSDLAAGADTLLVDRRHRLRRPGLRRHRACRPLRAHHDRRRDAGRARHRRAAGVPTQAAKVEAARCASPPRWRSHRPAGVGPGDNRRLAGEDLARGSAALRAGRVLRPADLGLLASLGQAEVPVFRRLRVAFFSTGDELRSIGEPLDAGCVYDSNRYTLWGMLQRLGCEVLDLGVVRDEPGGIACCLQRGRSQRRCGDHLGRRQRRRGRPHQADHGRARRRAVLAHRDAAGAADGDRAHRERRQRGDPVRPARQPGRRDGHLLRLRARRAAGDERRHRRRRCHCCVPPARRRCARSPAAPSTSAASSAAAHDGRWQVAITGSQGSGILSSMSAANGMVVLHHAQGDVAAGDEVDVIPFDGLV